MKHTKYWCHECAKSSTSRQCHTCGSKRLPNLLSTIRVFYEALKSAKEFRFKVWLARRIRVMLEELELNQS